MDDYEYTGHLHIHSTFSDGSSPVDEIASHAAGAGLDFIGITDHNTLEGLKRGLEGYHHGVLVFFGTEINMKKNHYIAFGLSEEIPQDEENPQRVIDAVNEQGGFGYLAHPVEKSNPLFMRGRYFAWDKWDVSRFTGMEIWNFGSRWRSAFRSKWQAFFWYFLHPYQGARFPDPDGLKIWDSLTLERPVTAFAGSDAHAYALPLGPIKIIVFPYAFLFRTLNTHILLEEKLKRDPQRDREQILGALRSGRFFIGSDYLGPTRGFRFFARNNDGQEVTMGQEIPFSSSTVLQVVSPSPQGIIRIIKNGRLVYESRQQSLAFKVLKQGVFRVEVYRRRPLWGRPLPWIFSNPIYVR